MVTKSLLTFALLALMALPIAAQDDEPADAGEHVYPAAIFPFMERGEDAEGLGAKITDILFANLIADPQLNLVDREEIAKLLDEQELGLSGLTNASTASKVGELTGAKILITGSVVQSDTTLYLVTKIVSTETGRVLGASVKGTVRDPLDDLVTALAGKITETLGAKGQEIMPKLVDRGDRLAELVKSVPEGKRPSVIIKIDERHVSQATIDPAAETEIAVWCDALGFKVLDAKLAGAREADIIITGEGFSELASRRGNLVSVKARLEVKAIERKSGKTLAIDREVAMAVELGEQNAGKAALQEAAANIAERILPKLAGGKEEGKKAAKEK